MGKEVGSSSEEETIIVAVTGHPVDPHCNFTIAPSSSWPRTPDSDSENVGSNPAGVATQ